MARGLAESNLPRRYTNATCPGGRHQAPLTADALEVGRPETAAASGSHAGTDLGSWRRARRLSRELKGTRLAALDGPGAKEKHRAGSAARAGRATASRGRRSGRFQRRCPAVSRAPDAAAGAPRIPLLTTARFYTRHRGHVAPADVSSPRRTALGCAHSRPAGPRLAQDPPWKPPRRPPSHGSPGAATRPMGVTREAPAGVGGRTRPADTAEREGNPAWPGPPPRPHPFRPPRQTDVERRDPPLGRAGRGLRRATPLSARVRLRSAADGGPSPAPSHIDHGHGGGA